MSANKCGVINVELGERKRKILQAIIDDYIGTAEPVGSRTIAKKHELGISSATIRNEMADLEEMGYLEQPHTSAGRIPSDLGYRLYVDQLMKRHKFTIEELQRMRQAMELKIQELDHLIQQASNVISQYTKYTTVALTPELSKSSIKHLQLIPIDIYNALMVVVTNAGVVKNKTIRLSKIIDSDFCMKLSKILNEKLGGLTIEEINLPKIQEIQKEISSNEELVVPILNTIADCISDIDRAEVYLGGTTNIFNFPEYNHIDKARELLSFLEEKKNLYKLLVSNNKNKDRINIVIGSENQFEEMKGCSVVMSTYSIGSKIVGTIGIIGPTRMNYSKVVSSLDVLTRNLNTILMKCFNEDGSNI